ncbi:MAG: hypothetical protein MK324_09830 [Pirellulales bacterium]|nr:hypothetical protein [Pirellulales bacterium]|tara:strand:+ start:29 stop:427 length:399 start_codon:yes stop_codon:yes gene_type:complete
MGIRSREATSDFAWLAWTHIFDSCNSIGCVYENDRLRCLKGDKELVFLGTLCCILAALIEIGALIAWIYILIHAFREYELWVGVVSIITPLFVYVAFDSFKGKKLWWLIGLTVASHGLSVPLYLGGVILRLG